MNALDFKHLKGDENWINPCLIHKEDSGLKERLFAGEEYFNNWGGDTLILGQDSRGVSIKDRNLYFGQNPDMPFNKLILKTFSDFNAVLGNVFWFYRVGRTTGNFKKMSKNVESSNKMILKKTINEMKNLKKIFCLGKNSYSVFCSQMNIDFKKIFFSSSKMNDITVYCLPHPGYHGILNLQKEMKITRKDAEIVFSNFIKSLN